jgi:hypothetical protein
MARCYDCQNYANLVTKATGGGVHFSREDFVAWKRNQVRCCHYCGLEERDLYRLGVVNVRTRRVMEAIGVDRIDNALPYTLENIVLCCGPCNAIKSSILSASEMEQLGSALSCIWAARLEVRD